MKTTKIVTSLIATMLFSAMAIVEAVIPLAIVEKNGKQGCIDTTGKIVIPLEYTKIDMEDSTKGDLVAVEEKGKIGIYHRDGSVLYKSQFDKVGILGEEVFAAEINGKWGFYDLKGNTLAQGFDAAGIFREDRAPVKKQGLWGYINKQGEQVIPFAYKEAGNFSEGVAAVKVNNKWGYLTQDGDIALEPIYKKAGEFHQGMALVNGKTFIDVTGQPVIHVDRYNYVGDFRENGLSSVGLRIRHTSFLDFISLGLGWGNWGPWWDHGWGWGGTIFIDPSTLDRGSMHRGYINQEGKEVISPENDYVGPFVDGLAIVANGNKWGMVNEEGLTVIPYMYERLLPFSSGLAAFRFSKKWGFIDENNAMVISNKFDGVTAFNGEYATAIENNKGGVIDKKGKFVFAPLSKYKEIGTISFARAPVRVEGKWGYIGLDGLLAIKPEYDKASAFR